MISLRRGERILSGSSAALRHTTPLLLCVKANSSMETLHNDYISLFCIVSHGRQCANERYKWKYCIAGRINLRIEYLIDFTSTMSRAGFRQDPPFELLPSGRFREGDYGIRSSRHIAHAATADLKGIRNTGADESSRSSDW
jgi:hypothetical protein